MHFTAARPLPHTSTQLPDRNKDAGVPLDAGATRSKTSTRAREPFRVPKASVALSRFRCQYLALLRLLHGGICAHFEMSI